MRLSLVVGVRVIGLTRRDTAAASPPPHRCRRRRLAAARAQVTTGMSGIPTATVTMIGPDGVSRFCAEVR